MKKTLTGAVLFIPASSSVTIDVEQFDVRKLYAIINQTSKTLIFATATPGLGFSSVNGSQITLEYNCSTMNPSDSLQIIYDDDEEIQYLASINKFLSDLSFLTSVRGIAADLRTTVVNTVPVTISSGTVSNMANQAAMGGYATNPQIPAIQNIVSAQGNINNITVTIS